MIRTILLSITVSALPLAAAAQTPAQAPAYKPALTKDGQPDCQGVWENRWLTPIERPAQAKALIATPEQAKAMTAAMEAGRRAAPGNTNPDSDFDLTSLVRVKGEYRTSLVVDPEDG